jgi:limonene 1,2-monooxygenase
MMEESLEAIIALLTSDEPVNMVTDWFTLKDARLQLRPYTHPCFEIGVAAQVSPAGPRAAGRFGASLLSLGATTAGGFDVLGAHWQTCEERAAQFGATVDRRRWRLVGPMHIRETEEQARRDVEHGLADWIGYFREVAALPVAPEVGDHDSLVEAMNNSGIAVVGTPEMAIAQIQRLVDQSGGFGTYLFMAHEWADRQATLASYELFAREVMPAFQSSAERTVRSRNWAAENRPDFIGAAIGAIGKAISDHQAEKELVAGAAEEVKETSETR